MTPRRLQQKMNAPDTQPKPQELAGTPDTQPRVGERFSAHFVTAIVARVPREMFKPAGTDEPIDFASLEVGAFYVAGTVLGPDKKPDFGKQFHIQLTALADKEPKKNSPKAR